MLSAEVNATHAFCITRYTLVTTLYENLNHLRKFTYFKTVENKATFKRPLYNAQTTECLIQ